MDNRLTVEGITTNCLLAGENNSSVSHYTISVNCNGEQMAMRLILADPVQPKFTIRLHGFWGGGRLTAITSSTFHPHWRALLSEFAYLEQQTHTLYRGRP